MLFRSLITQINADGNEIAGIRLPEIAVPLATHTGWNEYAKPHPEGELCDRDGSYAPFAATRAEREAKNDPRPSLEERYPTKAEYVAKVTAAAEAPESPARLSVAEEPSVVSADDESWSWKGTSWEPELPATSNESIEPEPRGRRRRVTPSRMS